MSKTELERFAEAYVRAALWSSGDDDGEPLDREHDVRNIAPATLARMRVDCATFLTANAARVDAGAFADNAAQAGHDFWLNRNGHGCGFWDGDWPEPAAAELSRAAQRFGEFNLYVGDDGKIHH